jgi:hypothetical protein
MDGGVGASGRIHKKNELKAQKNKLEERKIMVNHPGGGRKAMVKMIES